MPKGKPTVSKKELEEAKAHFWGLLDQLGPLNVKPYALQNQYPVDRRTLDRWKEEFIEQEGVIDIKRHGDALRLQTQMALDKLALAISKNKGKDQAEAAANFVKILKAYTEFLEAWGYKDAVQGLVQEHRHKVELTKDTSGIIKEVFTKKQLDQIAKKLEKTLED